MLRSNWMLAGLAAAMSSFLAVAPVGAQEEEKPYSVVDGKVDKGTYNGYRRYGDACLRCHGPDGAGGSYAPNLTESLQRLSYDQFTEVVINGRQGAAGGQQSVMPAFGEVEDVATYIDDIYGYLKGRSDGVIDRGRPNRQ